MKRRVAHVLLMLAIPALIIACRIGTATNASTEISQTLKSTGAVQSTEPLPTQAHSGVMVSPSPIPSPTEMLPSLTPTLGIGSTKESASDGMIQDFIPAGEFIMGSDSYNEIMSAPVSLDAFWIDQTEVTNAMFAEFVSATHYRTDAEKKGNSYVYQPSADDFTKKSGANWQHPHGPGSDLKDLEQYPVVQVSWNDARAYCKWAGRRLPTEAEWEKAARGTDGRLHPWGDQEWAGNLANFMDKQLNPDYPVDDGYAGIAPVGNYPDGASPFGVLDMVGNVAEWVADWYVHPYPQGDQDTVVINPQGPASGESRGMRGGAWTSNDENNGERRLAAHRNWNKPNLSADSSGFRCAASQ
jgi:formylglycine-generating enzyme required for sulfatase activity